MRWSVGGYGKTVTSALTPDEPIGDQVPIADAVDQRRQVSETRGLSEDFEPTEVNEFAAAGAPEEANPADWQEQLTTAAGADDWDPEDL